MIKQPVIIERTTNETRVRVELGGGAEILSVKTPMPMFTHMLEQLGFYWGVGLVVAAEEPVPCGDGHHLVEDVAITLGQALDQWLAARNHPVYLVANQNTRFVFEAMPGIEKTNIQTLPSSFIGVLLPGP